MRIRVLSDLHLEFHRRPEKAKIFDDVACDVVVLAGDIHNGVKGIEWAARTFDRPVVYVLGNHEYYEQDADLLIRDARARAEALGIQLLEKDEVRIDGYRFLGCTLWTDFSLGTEPRYVHACLADELLSDFRMIRYQGSKVTLDAVSRWHTKSRRRLASKPNKSVSQRICTDTGTTWALSNQRGYLDESGSGFRKDYCLHLLQSFSANYAESSSVGLLQDWFVNFP